jgi:type I restriction enzyme M protein
MKKALENIKQLELNIKETKAKDKELLADLDEKIEFKMYGTDEAKEYLTKLLRQNRQRLHELEAQPETSDGKQKNARAKAVKDLTADNLKIETKLDGLDKFLEKIGGVITNEECKQLILQKHNNLIRLELGKYLNAEKRKLIGGIEKLWDKYAVHAEFLENERAATLNKLNGFLRELNYLN